MKAIVVLRTHVWNDSVEFIARRLKGYATGLDFYILVDETKGELNVSPFEKISHTSDMSALKLPHYPEGSNNLHYNGDYPLLYLRELKKNYDYYIMVENDCIVNIYFDKLITTLKNENIDLFSEIDQVDNPVHKENFPNIENEFSKTGRAFFPFVAASGRLLDFLYHKRLDLATKYQKGNTWLYCEVFTASAALSFEKFKTKNISEILDISRYTFMNHKYYKENSLYSLNTINHPVIGDNFFHRYLECNNAMDIFNKNSDLFLGINSLDDKKEAISYISNLFIAEKNLSSLLKFQNMCFELSWIENLPETNIALFKNADQSSVCEWSRFNNTEQDASLVVDGLPREGSKSHTNKENNPWWLVDLEIEYEIRAIIIYPRNHMRERFKDFKISGSLNKTDWFDIFISNQNFTLDDKIKISFPKNVFCKYIKIIQLGYDFMHLNQVEVFSY